MLHPAITLNKTIDNLNKTIDNLNEMKNAYDIIFDSIEDEILSFELDFNLSVSELVKNVFTQDYSSYFVEKPETGERKYVTFPLSIAIVGCGGLGSWFVPRLMKILNDGYNKHLIGKTTIFLIDGDHVEEKNVIRQNFVIDDIGLNKAEVLANRYADFFNENIQIIYVPKYLKTSLTDSYERDFDQSSFVNLNQITKTYGSKKLLVINLIDNAITRKSIHHHLMALTVNKTDVYHIIDVGCNRYNGQLTYANTQFPITGFYGQFPEHLKDNEDLSINDCSIHDVTHEDQMFNINDLAVTVLANFINGWIVNSYPEFTKITFDSSSKMNVKSFNRIYPFYFYSFRAIFNSYHLNFENLFHKDEQIRIDTATNAFHYANNKLIQLDKSQRHNDFYTHNATPTASNLIFIWCICNLLMNLQNTSETTGLLNALKAIDTKFLQSHRNIGANDILFGITASMEIDKQNKAIMKERLTNEAVTALNVSA